MPSDLENILCLIPFVGPLFSQLQDLQTQFSTNQQKPAE